MNRSQIRSLKLNRETVRTLTPVEMQYAVGGDIPSILKPQPLPHSDLCVEPTLSTCGQ